MMQDATRARIEEREKQKAEVFNTLTANGDIAKSANFSGGSVVLTPTVNTYLSDNPQKDGPSMEIKDATVTQPAHVQGSSMLDQARMSLEQPKGDEFSSASARGPLLPEGAVVAAIQEEETTEVPFTPEMTSSERLERIGEQEKEASEAARVEGEKLRNEQEAEAGSEEGAGDVDSHSAASAPKSGSKPASVQRATSASGRKTTAKKGGKGK